MNPLTDEEVKKTRAKLYVDEHLIEIGTEVITERTSDDAERAAKNFTMQLVMKKSGEK